jgi:hypothetical protein
MFLAVQAGVPRVFANVNNLWSGSKTCGKPHGLAEFFTSNSGNPQRVHIGLGFGRGEESVEKTGIIGIIIDRLDAL